MNQIIKNIILGFIGGIFYYCIELIYKGGHSHWSMFILGGICFVIIGYENEFFKWETPIWKQATIGAIIVTVLEFITGCVVNIWLGWNVWNYSELPLNIGGQVCLPFTIIWFFISILVIILDDYLRYWLFGEEKPHYVLF